MIILPTFSFLVYSMETMVLPCIVVERNLETMYVKCPRKGLAHTRLSENGGIMFRSVRL